MALSPKYAGLATKVSGGEAVHTIELCTDSLIKLLMINSLTLLNN